MEAALAIALKLAVGAIGVFGGRHAVEAFLENYLMDRVPVWARGLVVPVVAFGSALASALYGGADLATALTVALGAWGLIEKAHKDALAALPPPPADPLSVPGDGR